MNVLRFFSFSFYRSIDSTYPAHKMKSLESSEIHERINISTLNKFDINFITCAWLDTRMAKFNVKICIKLVRTNKRAGFTLKKVILLHFRLLKSEALMFCHWQWIFQRNCQISGGGSQRPSFIFGARLLADSLEQRWWTTMGEKFKVDWDWSTEKWGLPGIGGRRRRRPC